MRKYLTEFIGTFFLVLVIATTVRANAALAPLAIGLALAAMVFAGGHVSGAHYNPAVTLAVWIRGKIATTEIGGYLLGQVSGALAAGGIARWLVESPAQPFTVSGRVGVALVAEILLTFALAYVVLNVITTSSDHPGNSFYGLAIGGTVAAGAISVGAVSGGVFNPAVAFGVAQAHVLTWSSVWLYLVADLIGGALAGLAYRVLNPAEFTSGARATAPAGVSRSGAARGAHPRPTAP